MTYVVRGVNAQDTPAVLELLQDSLAGGPTGERTADFFHWKHRDSPFGASPGLVADAAGRLVGVRLLMRWSFLLGGQRVKAVRMVDTATAPDWQGKGIFKALTLQALETSDADLCFNTPNSQSLPGYLKMGWTTVGQVPMSIRVQRPLRLASAVVRRQARQVGLSGVPIPVASSLPTASSVLEHPGLPQLLEDAEHGARRDVLRTERSLEFLTWRYGKAPGLDYRAVPVERGGRLVGVGFGRARRRGPLAELTLGDVIVRPGDSHAARGVLRASARAGTDHVVVRRSSDAWRAGFVSPPRVGLTLTSRGLREVPVDLAHLSSWQLALGDLELF